MVQQESYKVQQREMPSPAAGGEWPWASGHTRGQPAGKQLHRGSPGAPLYTKLIMSQQYALTVKINNVLAWIRGCITSSSGEVTFPLNFVLKIWSALFRSRLQVHSAPRPRHVHTETDSSQRWWRKWSIWHMSKGWFIPERRMLRGNLVNVYKYLIRR